MKPIADPTSQHRRKDCQGSKPHDVEARGGQVPHLQLLEDFPEGISVSFEKQKSNSVELFIVA